MSLHVLIIMHPPINFETHSQTFVSYIAVLLFLKPSRARKYGFWLRKMSSLRGDEEGCFQFTSSLDISLSEILSCLSRAQSRGAWPKEEIERDQEKGDVPNF